MERLGSQREGKEGTKEASKVLSLFNTREAKLYWIKAIARIEGLNEGQQGYLIAKVG